MLPLNERIFFYKYLSRLLESGVAKKQALMLYIKDLVLKAKHKKELNRALFIINKNSSLARALFIARVIPAPEYEILKFTEKKQKNFIKTLAVLSKTNKQQATIKRKIKTVLIYPGILLAEFFTILMLLIFWLGPQIQFFFRKLHIASPMFLNIASTIYNAILKLNTIYFYIIITFVIFILYRAYLFFSIKQYLTKSLLYIPKLNTLYKLIITQQIFAHWSIIAGTKKLKILKELKLLRSVTKNTLYKKMFRDLYTHLKHGHTIQSFFFQTKNKKLFPVVAIRLLILTERDGNFSKEIKIISEILTEELELELKDFISILEPVLILSIAGFVMILGLTLQNILSQMQSAVIGG